MHVRRRLAMESRDKPEAVFLLAGPPGTGKTLLAKRLAAELKRPLLHVDMAQLSASHASSSLFGSPPGYAGSDSYGRLTGQLKAAPDTIVLLDEIEKAHPDLLRKFLVAWNDGIVTEASSGEAVSCRRSVFVLTTNAAATPLAEAAEDFAGRPERLRQESVAILRDAEFAPETLDRIDGIFVFRALDPGAIETIADLEVRALADNYGIEIVAGGIDQGILFDLMRTQLRGGASARDLARAVEHALSDVMVDARAAGAKRIRLVQDVGGAPRAEPAER